MTTGAQIVAALQAYDDALHGKSGTTAERVVAMTAALEAARRSIFPTGRPTVMGCWTRDQERRV